MPAAGDAEPDDAEPDDAEPNDVDPDEAEPATARAVRPPAFALAPGFATGAERRFGAVGGVDAVDRVGGVSLSLIDPKLSGRDANREG